MPAEELPGESDPFGESEVPVEDLLGESDLFGESEVPAEDLLGELDPFGESEMPAENLLAADSGDSEEGIFGAMDEMLSDEDVLKMLAEDGDDAERLSDLTEKTENETGADELGGFDSAVDDIFETADVRNPQAEQEKAENRKASAGEKEMEAAGEDRESPAQKKERKKAEAAVKKAEKQAAREAARLAKAEKKAQQGKKEQKPVKKASAGAEESVETAGRKAQAEELLDMSLLDSILSEANSAGKKPEPQEEAEDQLGFLDMSGEEPIDFSFGEEEPAHKMKNDLGIDLDGMFPDSGIDLGEGDSFAFSDDAMELDLEEADQMIPERSTGAKGGKKGGEKKSLFSRLRDFLTEEDEEEDGENPFFQDGQDSEEGPKGKPGGNKKSKKGSASKKEKEKPKKEAKPKKPAKPKKAPKKEKASGKPSPDNGKKLSFKKMFPVLVIGVSVGVLLFLFVNAATVYSDRNNARTAFYMGDYNTCYQYLKGKRLDETESIMFGKSASILYSRLWIREYEVFTERGDSVRALDSLVQAIDYYPELQEYAASWNALSEVASGYAEVLNLLESKFGLTESQAKEIALQRRDVDYTRMITAIAGGQSSGKESGTGVPGSQNTPDAPKDSEEAEGSSADQSLADLLPEEEGIGDNKFIGN